MSIIAVVGAYGKMGQPICARLRENGFDVRGVDAKSKDLKALDDIREKIDLVIDFSTKDNSLCVLQYCVRTRTRLIMGTTGQGESFATELNLAATKIPIIKCDNFSTNVQKFVNLARVMSKNFDGEIAVVETHHKKKLDAPSGTAKVLISALCDQKDKNISCNSLRGGTIFGRHEIHFFDDDEEIIISHSSYSRRPFVNGLMRAVDFLLQKDEPKQYNFERVLDEIN